MFNEICEVDDINPYWITHVVVVYAVEKGRLHWRSVVNDLLASAHPTPCWHSLNHVALHTLCVRACLCYTAG